MHTIRTSATVIAALCAALIGARQISAQTTPVQTPAAPALKPADEHPRIGKVNFDGATHLRGETLRDSIATQATRCRGLILKPLCAISKSPSFVERHYLNRADLPKDELRIRVIYFKAGYREARVTSEVTEPEPGKVDVTFHIVEGPGTTLSAVNVKQLQEVLTGRQIRQALLPRPGELLNLPHIDSAKIRLRGTLWDRGYGDAVVTDAMTIDASTHTAVLGITIDPVHVTTVDTIIIQGNKGVSTNTVRRLLGLTPGDVYRRTDMTAAQRRLYETELFRQTLVTVPETKDSAKQVTVTLREAPFRAMRVGFGFNTTEFGQTELRYTRYNWFGGARRLDVRAAAGNLLASPLYGKSVFGSAAPLGIAGDVDRRFLTPTWEIGANLNEPFVLDARASLGVGVNTHRRSIPGIVIDRGFGANASATWRFLNGIPASLTYQFEQNRVEAGDLYFCINFGVCGLNTVEALRGRHKLSPLGITAHAERSDDPLEPSRGYNARLDLEHASHLTASDFRYNRAEAEMSRYLPRGRSVIAMHVHGGWVKPLESTSEAIGIEPTEQGVLHPRKRFYAGGARSVRGFGENQLGPRVLTIDPARLLTPSDTGTVAPCTEASIIDGSCDPNVALSNQFVPRPLGGNTLIEGSIEYRFQLTQSLRAAVFVDAGTVRGQRLNLPPGNRTGITPGFGVRYSSPIGPVRVDLGIRPGLTEDVPVVTQFMGADSTLHLVQLTTPKHYNPREGQTGFLRGITSRLQLHLAIGEAW
jgi:outer membrane protein assembly factor BamA